ncbi:hypothetical protein L1887_08882 [Cichorium endivia]|nr:hypothetical protein L1887_08882 [Cichorium endivia]
MNPVSFFFFCSFSFPAREKRVLIIACTVLLSVSVKVYRIRFHRIQFPTHLLKHIFLPFVVMVIILV